MHKPVIVNFTWDHCRLPMTALYKFDEIKVLTWNVWICIIILHFHFAHEDFPISMIYYLLIFQSDNIIVN